MRSEAKPKLENVATFSGESRKRRGCLWGCLGQLVLLFVLGSLVVLGVDAIIAPWSFYLGGKFHIIPYWQGWGTLHSKNGDYTLFVRFEPSPHGSRMYAASHLTGVGYLCTPRGERFRMNLGGDMRAHLNLSTDGEAIHLYMNNWPVIYGQFLADHRPSIQLRGHWKNPDLVMDDNSSLFRAFQPDGRAYLGHDPNRPYNGGIVPVTLKQGSYSEFEAACKR